MKKIVSAFIALLFLIGCSEEKNGDIPMELQENLPPLAFELISPAEGAEVDVYDITFEWESATDPENDIVTYDLYLYRDGASPLRIAQDINETSYTLDSRSVFNSTFGWYVVAKDGKERGQTTTPERNFTTRSVRAEQVSSEGTIALFSPRYASSGVYFKDRFLIINGFGDGIRGDVWSSRNYGRQWALETDLDNTGFERYAHSSVVFDDKIWIIGGYDTNPIGNIYSSTDGINWAEEDFEGSFGRRYEHTSVVFDNKIWVIGGYDDDIFLDDVVYWTGRSQDSWTVVSDGIQTPFDGIRGHSSVVFDDKIWVIGGTNRKGYVDEVWVTSDGRNWSESTNLPVMSAYHKSVVFDNKIWIIGGLTTSGPSNQVYYYDKTTSTWVAYEMPEAFRALYNHTVLTVDNKTPDDGIYVLGSFDGSKYSNEIWKLY